ncbi:MAG: L-serine ammonia-lyase, iron-sulfur-dependent, subunit alpha [Candidatus Heimdallarchaeota archaeon]|nr:MAG: L-serine ammonia-lyase, iron-sulfur-dependent, subunit alpha [Candidatus Heimdallarchaeota archaeon]
MRGPSSSHCAASVRIGKMARDLMGGNIQEVSIEFDTKGSLATTHESQGSDMGLYGGFLGWEAFDERLIDSAKAIREAGIKISMEIRDLNMKHPNTYKLTLKNDNETHEMITISIGGGMIEVVEIDKVKVSMAGDYFETIVFTNVEEVSKYLQETLPTEKVLTCKGDNTCFIEVKSEKPLGEKILNHLITEFNIIEIKEIKPVLPVLSRKEMKVPFITYEEMLKYNEDKNLDLWELAIHYESVRGNLSADEVFTQMQETIKIMQKSISDGIKGTDYDDRILGYQSGFFKTQMEKKRLLDGGILNQMILYITALIETKSSMGVIVAAPTAGACGAVPGALIGAATAMDLNLNEITRAMLAAGIIGIFISSQSTFSAEIGGCQAECGSASGMAAAGLVTLMKGDTQQAIDAASMALQNIFGMVCDPVANRVEVPCLGKNVLAASNAFACANMALANFDVVIPLGEVIEAMDKVGRSIPHELRCTALGGLSVTKTSKLLEEKLKEL